MVGVLGLGGSPSVCVVMVGGVGGGEVASRGS